MSLSVPSCNNNNNNNNNKNNSNFIQVSRRIAVIKPLTEDTTCSLLITYFFKQLAVWYCLMFKTIFEYYFKVVDNNSCYVTIIVTFHDSKVSKLKREGNVQLFDGHVATIKTVIIQIKLNRCLVNKFSKTISSHLKSHLVFTDGKIGVN